MTQTLPSLTVVVPNFNHGHLIGDQLHAIFAQSVQPARIFIVDDASTDDSVSVIRELISKRPDVELLCKRTNSGVIAVVNECLRLADTEYIAFTAADDLLLPGFVEKSLSLLARYPDAGICSTASRVQDATDSWEIPDRIVYPLDSPGMLEPNLVSDLLRSKGNWFMGNAAVYRREALLAVGGFDPELGAHADNFVFQVLGLRYGACFVPEVLAINRRSGSSLSATQGQNADVYELLLRKSNTRMTTTFRDLFPEKLIARNNARMLFWVLCARLDNLEGRTRAVVQATRLSGGSLLLFVAHWATRTLKLAFFCVLRFRDIPRVVLSRLFRRRSPSDTNQAHK